MIRWETGQHGINLDSGAKKGNLRHTVYESKSVLMYMHTVWTVMSINHSDLVVLSLCLQLQLYSAYCLCLTQQQLLGMLQRPHHLLYKHTHTHNILGIHNGAIRHYSYMTGRAWFQLICTLKCEKVKYNFFQWREGHLFHILQNNHAHKTSVEKQHQG